VNNCGGAPAELQLCRLLQTTIRRSPPRVPRARCTTGRPQRATNQQRGTARGRSDARLANRRRRQRQREGLYSRLISVLYVTFNVATPRLLLAVKRPM
jgi:hypothetical protein